jgi:hypothetical protein
MAAEPAPPADKGLSAKFTRLASLRPKSGLFRPAAHSF